MADAELVTNVERLRCIEAITDTAVAVFLFDLMVLPPRFTLVMNGPAMPQLLVFSATAATIVAVLGRLLRSDSARIEAESRSGALAEQARLIAPVLDGSPIGVAVFDTALRYTYLNSALALPCGAQRINRDKRLRGARVTRAAPLHPPRGADRSDGLRPERRHSRRR